MADILCFKCGTYTPASPKKIPSSVIIKSDDDEGIVFERRPPKLYSIFETDSRYNQHRAMLEEWRAQAESSERRLARKQASESSSRADLYQILGLFFVFQGVVVTAVAQSNLLRCANWYLPFALSLLVSIAALGASIQKIKEAAEFCEQVQLEKVLYKAINKSLDNLKEEGTEFDIQKGLPELAGNYTAGETKGVGTVKYFFTLVRNFGSQWIWSYSGAVLLLLISFSGVTLFSVPRILCHPDGR